MTTQFLMLNFAWSAFIGWLAAFCFNFNPRQVRFWLFVIAFNVPFTFLYNFAGLK